MAKNKLLLIDSSALIYRAFYALPPLSDRHGRTVNAVYGFISAFLNVIKKVEPTHVVFTFDSPKPNFRKKIYPEYKAQRAKAPDELYRQIPLAKKAAEAFGFPCLDQPGFEADDIVGFLAKKFLKENSKNQVVIATGDLDTLQLVNSRLQVFSLSRGINEAKIYDEKAIKERFGLKPEQIIDYKSLFGDASDNIKGVKGIGQKTASSLLQKYETLENIYDNLRNLSPKLEKILSENKENAFLSKKIVTLAHKLPSKIEWSASSLNKKNLLDGGNYLAEEFSFGSLLNRIKKNWDPEDRETQKNSGGEKNKVETKIDLIEDTKSLDEFVQKISHSPFVIAWSGKGPFGVSLALGLGRNQKIDTAFLIKPDFDFSKISHLLRGKKIFCFDEKKILKDGFDFLMEANVIDLKLETYLIQPPFINKYSFKETVWHFLKYRFEEPKEQLSLLGFLENGYTHQKIVEILNLTLKLKDEVESAFEEQVRFQKEKSFNRTIFPHKQIPFRDIRFVLEKIETPLSSLLAEIEDLGIKVDKALLEKMRIENAKELSVIKNQIFTLAGATFNLDSPSQLADILFSKMKIIPLEKKRGKAGHFSTAAGVLEKLEEVHPIIPHLLLFREKRKLQTTYFDSLLVLVNSKTKRVHSNFDQTGTTTGRISSSNPNLQNIPVSKNKGDSLRKIFVAEEGFSLVSLDYSQIEFRIAAYLTEEKKLIEAFEKGFDIHKQTASIVKKIPIDEVSSQERSAAKALNFGVLYGMSAFGFAQSAKISETEARIFIQNYFREFPAIAGYMEKTKRFVTDFGFVETAFGRRRYFSEMGGNNRFLLQARERMAINMPFQGTAADIMKMALIKVNEYLKKVTLSKNENRLASVVLTVHDEIILEVKDELLKQIVPEIKKIMGSVAEEILPLKVDASVGKNWGDL